MLSPQGTGQILKIVIPDGSEPTWGTEDTQREKVFITGEYWLVNTLRGAEAEGEQ